MKFAKQGALFAIPLAVMFGAGASLAQSVEVDDDTDNDAIVTEEQAPAVADPDADLLDGSSTRIIERRDRDGPAVYGWQGCGTFYYWNGETCVDARYKSENK